VYAAIPLSDTQFTFIETQKLKAKISKRMGRKTKVVKENLTDSAIQARVPVYILLC
jgi:hypothetical protein